MRSAGSSWAISASSAPQMRTTWTSLFGGAFFYGFGVGVAGGEAGLVDVGDVELGLGGDEEELAGVGFFFVGEIDGAGGLAGFEGLLELG